MKQLILITIMLLTSIANAQEEECPTEDCSTPIVFDFTCPDLTCDDNLTFAVGNRITVYSNINADPTVASVIVVRSNDVLLNGNHPTPGRYWTDPNENALLDGEYYFSAKGFTIDIVALGVIECILINN